MINKSILISLLCTLSIGVFAQSKTSNDSQNVTSIQKVDVKPENAEKAATDPTVDQIIDKFENAIGGRAAFEKFSSRTVRGTFELPSMGVSSSMEILSKAPNKQYSIVTVPGYGNVIHGFDGKIAWTKDPASGLREKSGVELAIAKIDAEYNKEIKLRQLYSKLELKGKEKVGERETYVIIATPSEGKPEKWYFDLQNGLLLRCDMEREGPEGVRPFEVYFEDYRDVDGVKISFILRMINPSVTMILKFDSVKHNEQIDDAKFVKQ